jgi:hypothetical protein
MYRVLRKCNGIVIVQIKGQKTRDRSTQTFTIHHSPFTIHHSYAPHITRRICRRFVGKSICIAC